MPRPPRFLYADGVYHVMARGNNKMQLFHDSQDFRFYRKLWKLAKDKFSLKIHRWCFMPNHIHLIVKQLTDDGLPKAMHYIQQRYAKYYGRRYKWVGHVWQGRYTSRLIADDAYLYQCGKYVENNPVRAGLVDRAENYIWSSAYARARGFDDGVVDNIPIFEGNASSNFSASFKCNFDATKVGALKNGRTVLGAPESVAALARKFGEIALKKHGRPRKEEKVVPGTSF